MSGHIELLNRRLGEELGLVCGGALPRFAWRWAPDELWLVYDRDDRTLIRKSWADWPMPDGNPIGRRWVLGQFRKTTAYDHCGYGEGTRVAVIRDHGWHPHFEAVSDFPTENFNQNLIWAIRYQMSMSEEHAQDSMSYWLAEEKFEDDQNEIRNAKEHLDRSMKAYDDHVGAFGNCEPGLRDGFLSWGGIGDSPLVKKLAEAGSAI